MSGTAAILLADGTEELTLDPLLFNDLPQDIPSLTEPCGDLV